MMIRRYQKGVVLWLMLCLPAVVFAQTGTVAHPTIMVPAGSISRIVNEILPYELYFGKNFPRNIFLQSVDELKIEPDRFTFRVLIFGKNIEHTIKIGDQTVSLKIGKVNLSYGCEALYRYDREKGILFITPRIKDITRKEKMGQGNKILSPLLEAMSDIEYPIEIQKIKPFVTRLGTRTLSVKFDISKIYTTDNMLFFEAIPKVSEKSEGEPK